MREAAIVSTARTGVGKAYRGAFNNTEAPVLSAHVIDAAVARAGIDPARVDDLYLGVGNHWGTQSYNLGRLSVHASVLPDETVSGFTLDRKCSSGLNALALAARGVMTDEIDVAVTGGVESISLTLNKHAPTFRNRSKRVIAHDPHAYMAMIETAELVADRYNVSREDQDRFAALSQQRAAAAQAAGLFDDEIVPLTTTRTLFAKTGEETGEEEITLSADEGVRAGTTYEALAGLKPVFKDGLVIKEGRHVTAGNASQLSDGASAQVVMDLATAQKENLPVLGVYRGFQVAACKAEEMGIGPVFAIPKLLKRAGLTMQDIGLFEINEAFASQALYCQRHLDIDPDKLNVNGGGIAIGHPFGMTGSRLVGHALIEGKRRGVKYVVVSMCVAGGMGAAGLFEVA
ncbi:MAG: acetyl-CoA C-acyltransferase [Candidatus Brevundimonas phytovorans]|nr:acetyl-CoA C-acyltransferase [Brevundimonas sp.]WEK56774.1 MAG: acetyl-CoA C-acyltransferase [Brevundimonas sp.]